MPINFPRNTCALMTREISSSIPELSLSCEGEEGPGVEGSELTTNRDGKYGI